MSVYDSVYVCVVVYGHMYRGCVDMCTKEMMRYSLLMFVKIFFFMVPRQQEVGRVYGLRDTQVYTAYRESCVCRLEKHFRCWKSCM